MRRPHVPPFTLGKIYKSLRLGLSMVHLSSLICQPLIHLLLVSNVRACDFYRLRYFVSNKRVLDFHSTISLADYSQEQPRYSFVPIKDAWLAAAHPLCSYRRGLRHFSSFATVDFCLIVIYIIAQQPYCSTSELLGTPVPRWDSNPRKYLLVLTEDELLQWFP